MTTSSAEADRWHRGVASTPREKKQGDILYMQAAAAAGSPSASPVCVRALSACAKKLQVLLSQVVYRTVGIPSTVVLFQVHVLGR